MLHSENGRTFKLSLLLIVLYHQHGVGDFLSDIDVITKAFVKETDVEHASSPISNCLVRRETDGLNVDCSNRGFITVPQFPQNTITVDL